MKAGARGAGLGAQAVRVAALLSLFAVAPTVHAVALRVLSAGAIEPALRPAVAAYEHASGDTVVITFATAPQIAARLADSPRFDLVIAPPAVLDELMRGAKVTSDAAQRVDLGQVGLGVAVRADAPLPDIATPEAFKRTLLDAEALVFNRASTGLYFEGLLKRLGIDADVAAKTTRYADGAAVMAHVAQAPGRAIAIGATTEIVLARKDGIRLVGPLPPTLQNLTRYTATLSAEPPQPDAARALLRHLASAESRAGFTAAGVIASTETVRVGAAVPVAANKTVVLEPRPALTLEHCAAIGAPADRLLCYDRLAGRAPAEPPAPAAAASSPPATTLLAQRDSVPSAPPESQPPASLLSKYWELDPTDKRGTLNFVGYHPNYILPLHLVNRINRTPSSPTQAVVDQPDYQRAEAKFQVSLRSKLAQNLLLPGADLWATFSQVAFWQLYNSEDSKPFRNTDYEPELIYVVPTPAAWRALPFGVQWRFTQVALAHQSNGQSDPLSRSWNRVYVGAGFERGDWSLTTRFNQRLNEPTDSDNNPDLITYRGRSELQLVWAHGLPTASLQWRTNFNRPSKGSVLFEWTYPIARDQPNGLRWYVQAFSGYAETLTDYNFRQSSLGMGVTFLQF